MTRNLRGRGSNTARRVGFTAAIVVTVLVLTAAGWLFTYAGSPPSSIGGEDFPKFPWPPPSPSATTLLFIDKDRSDTLGSVSEALSSHLTPLGYEALTYFAVPGGFAIVTRPEQFDDDGRAKQGESRWVTEVEPLRYLGLRAIFDALRTISVARFRSLVFVVTNQPISAKTEDAEEEEVRKWTRDGVDRLPDIVKHLPYTSSHKARFLLYEFEKPKGENAKFVDQSSLSAGAHLRAIGLSKFTGSAP